MEFDGDVRCPVPLRAIPTRRAVCGSAPAPRIGCLRRAHGLPHPARGQPQARMGLVPVRHALLRWQLVLVLVRVRRLRPRNRNRQARKDSVRVRRAEADRGHGNDTRGRTHARQYRHGCGGAASEHALAAVGDPKTHSRGEAEDVHAGPGRDAGGRPSGLVVRGRSPGAARTVRCSAGIDAVQSRAVPRVPWRGAAPVWQHAPLPGLRPRQEHVRPARGRGHPNGEAAIPPALGPHQSRLRASLSLAILSSPSTLPFIFSEIGCSAVTVHIGRAQTASSGESGVVTESMICYRSPLALRVLI
mmetsp:Transcript_39850/g.105662  ORF Transcript_39850/g.105662 Transcript_39850/m.105662 type:complete len:302 (+) Transcript_39850:1065-1970(+)